MKRIVVQGLKALHNLANTIEANTAEVFVAKANGASLVVERTKKHKDDENFIRSACCILLHRLSRFEPLRKPLVDTNVEPSLVAAYEHYKNNCGSIWGATRGAIKVLLQGCCLSNLQSCDAS